MIKIRIECPQHVTLTLSKRDLETLGLTLFVSVKKGNEWLLPMPLNFISKDVLDSIREKTIEVPLILRYLDCYLVEARNRLHFFRLPFSM